MRDRTEYREREGKALLGSQAAKRSQIELSAEAKLAASILDARRRRERQFGTNLFADPAWDMLLDLFVQQESGNTVYVSSLCMASAVPTTTALRWIGTLTEAKLLERRPTGSNRKVEICLTRRARDLLRQHLSDTLDGLAAIADERPRRGKR